MNQPYPPPEFPDPGRPGSHPYGPGPYGAPGYGPGPYDPPYGPHYGGNPPAGAPGWQAPYGWPAPPPPPPSGTNAMAIAGFVLAFFCSPLGIIFSAVGLSQVGQTREAGRGLAIAGLVLSVVFTVLAVILATVTD